MKDLERDLDSARARLDVCKARKCAKAFKPLADAAEKLKS